ncbi:sigma-54-dependent transcriptional regulator [Negadavirga shengliensis]|uniref:Sigma-54-dependent transcriptional regulator n=1 Tax=Negadavirga shengliensis TaxID=1389218 RepID=A0ABV9SXX8_9BACT
MHKILIIDDELSVCQMLEKFLKKKGYHAKSTTSGKQGIKMLKMEFFDLVLCDYRLDDIDGRTLYPELRNANPEMVVIFITGYTNLKVAIELIKEGVYQYLEKPLRPDELLETLESALKLKKRNKSYPNRHETSSVPNQDFIIGKSSSSRELVKTVDLVGPTDYSVVIEGETGTGKESLAQLLHEKSARKDGPFIPIDCGSLSKEIAASELFGHEKGAYTGAYSDKTGAFELAKGGTVFLDEIGNLSMDIQVMLLRALQEKVVRKLGSLKPRKIDVRIIAATNENLRDKVRNGSFREDLYYRINEFNITVPPLRERRGDMSLLINHFITKTAEELGKPVPSLSDEVLEVFNRYSWPGNIRELKNVIRRTCLLSIGSETITSKVLPRHLMEENRGGGETKNFYVGAAKDTHKEVLLAENHTDLRKTAHMAEANHILKVLKEVGNNKTKAAKLLNIDRKTLYQKLKLYQLET